MTRLSHPGEVKPSGQRWLASIPIHWHAGPVKRFIARIESGTSVNATDLPAADGELGVLKTSCVYTGTFDPTENKTVVPNELDLVSCPVRPGSLIVSRMNTPDLVGAAGLVKMAAPNLYLPDRLWQISFDGIEPAFAHYWTQSNIYRACVKAVCAGTSASMQNLSQDDFRAFPFAAPARPEQIRIAGFLARETARIDALI